MAVRVRIGRLEVEGMAPGDARALAEALEVALRQGIAAAGPPRALPASVEAPAGVAPAALGRHVAGAILGGGGRR